MINLTTIQQIDEMLARLRVIRDAEFPHKTELRSHFNDAADKLDLLLNKLYHEGNGMKTVYDRKEQRAIGHFIDMVRKRALELREKSLDKGTYYCTAMEEIQKEQSCYD